MKWKRRLPGASFWSYWAVVAFCFVLALWVGETLPATQFDDYVYDLMLLLHPPPETNPEAVVLAIDDATLNAMGGPRKLRGILATAFELAVQAQPKVIASDVILADKGDPTEDAQLERALNGVKNLVLPAPISERDRWEEPLPRFRIHAAAVGHVEAERAHDGVLRKISLEKAAGHIRHWALALEAFRLSRGAAYILESPGDLHVGDVTIPAPRTAGDTRPMRIRYDLNLHPPLSVNDLKADPSMAATLRNKVVFLGVTSPSLSRDRVITPYGQSISGVFVHAAVFETLRRGDFLEDASDLSVLVSCAAIALLAGLIFSLASGWPAYLLGAALLLIVPTAPFWLFSEGIVFPYVSPFACAWLTVVAAASYQHFIVRKRLTRAEAEKDRYQQAIHFVTHEMRTPLTAIQGSSELMGRYNFTDDKRRQIAGLINSESKRLARMIQTFLDVERLSDGQMELKREPVLLEQAVEACVERARPLAERKNIAIRGGAIGAITGDNELIEYAIYNLLNNAVKYSPPDTEIILSAAVKKHLVFLSVADQGIGMDARELKQIFRKFYRTKRAEASGETGTGIGLSIVEQIVLSHGGRLEVSSMPGKGSCFTMILPLEEPLQ